MSAIPEPLAASLQDRYLLERELGRGGMATVYLARDLKHKRLVALKVLSPALGEMLGKERFLREIETAAQLQHPNILPVFDSGEAADQLWYTMPFVEGESLRDRIRSQGRLEISEAIRLVQEIAGALQAAHDRGIVHRDVKPENVLLSHGHALVADFGIALAPQTEAGPNLTQTGISLGTPAYMAPEQADGGHGNVDGRADQYALGCVGYELLAGSPPFAGRRGHAVIAAHLAEPVPDPRSVRAEIPDDVAAALRRALAKQPEDRFPSVAEFARALQRSPSGAAGARTLVTRRRHPRAWMLAAFFLAIAAAAVVTLLASRRTASRGGPPLLAVLPFDNQGSPQDDYFADGLADEVRGKLTQVPGLAVIARTSSGQYKKSSKPIRQIAGELGVRYILTGTVRWDKPSGGPSRVRVSPELLEVRPSSEPTTRWQAPFDAPMTDVFQVQADIAERVAQALDVQLSEDTRAKVSRAPTTNLAAHNAYLRGLGDPAAGDLALHGVPQLRRDTAALEEAVRLDPNFALAWAQLGRARLYLYNEEEIFHPVDNPLKSAKEAVGRALAIDSTLPAVRLAAALVAANLNDTAAFRHHRDAGLRVAPNDADLLATLPPELWSHMWAPAIQDSALAALERAEMLDPRSSRVVRRRFDALLATSRYAELLPVAERLGALAPSSISSMVARIQARLLIGDSSGAAMLARQRPTIVDSTEYLDALLGIGSWLLTPQQLRYLMRSTEIQNGDTLGYHFALLRIAHELRDDALVRTEAEACRLRLLPLLREHPDEPPLLVATAFADAMGGRLEQARTLVSKIQQMSNTSPMAAEHFESRLATLYLFAGVKDSALARTARSIRDRSIADQGIGVRYDRDWAPVREDPRFQAALNELISLGVRKGS